MSAFDSNDLLGLVVDSIHVGGFQANPPNNKPLVHLVQCRLSEYNVEVMAFGPDDDGEFVEHLGTWDVSVNVSLRDRGLKK